MLEIKDKVSFPCNKCLHEPVCALMSKMEQVRVSIPDDRFKAVIECYEFIPQLEEEKEEYNVVYPDSNTNNEEQT